MKTLIEQIKAQHLTDRQKGLLDLLEAELQVLQLKELIAVSKTFCCNRYEAKEQ